MPVADEPNFIHKLGRDLKVGDVVSVWWKPNGATLYSLEPYRGPLAYLFEPAGSQVGMFAKDPSPGAPKDRCPMTVDNAMSYPVVVKND